MKGVVVVGRGEGFWVRMGRGGGLLVGGFASVYTRVSFDVDVQISNKDFHAVVDLHGTETDIHSNKGPGIYALDRATVNIHLPSQHNTSHDNVGEDRYQNGGGSIANINADGTFTHVVQ